jgi:hypothetical protein
MARVQADAIDGESAEKRGFKFLYRTAGELGVGAGQEVKSDFEECRALSLFSRFMVAILPISGSGLNGVVFG